MKYNLIKLHKENDLNRLLKKQKKEKKEISILFISKWDKYSSALVEQLERKYSQGSEPGKPLYIVDNYHMPHSFVIFKSFMLPQLVNLGKNRVYVQEYLPEIYRQFELE